MKVDSSTLNTYTDGRSLNKSSSSTSNFSLDLEKMQHSHIKQESMANRFWNITDSMPRENQIDLAASVIAGRIINEDLTTENQAFLQNISKRFTEDEVAQIKQMVEQHPNTLNRDSVEVEQILGEIKQMLTNFDKNEPSEGQEQQAHPVFYSPDELFFRTTLKEQPAITMTSAV